ncbi:hypothetical protein ACHAW6_007830, partial [Cyclotella cf. meneghiniana]
ADDGLANVFTRPLFSLTTVAWSPQKLSRSGPILNILNKHFNRCRARTQSQMPKCVGSGNLHNLSNKFVTWDVKRAFDLLFYLVCNIFRKSFKAVTEICTFLYPFVVDLTCRRR